MSMEITINPSHHHPSNSASTPCIQSVNECSWMDSGQWRVDLYALCKNHPLANSATLYTSSILHTNISSERNTNTITFSDKIHFHIQVKVQIQIKIQRHPKILVNC